MTIRREYSLPNCKLVVEGLSKDGVEGEGRPLLSIVTSVECLLPGQKEPIFGGRALLDDLARTVSPYAQSFLSGISHPVLPGAHTSSVSLERTASDRHRLTLRPTKENSITNGQVPSDGSPLEFELGTVQLFDLVEAVDQLLLDQQTLPDLGLTLTAISRQYVANQEPLTKRALPAAVGVVSLAAAAAALFFLPIPERQIDPEPEPALEESPIPAPETEGGATPPDGESEEPDIESIAPITEEDTDTEDADSAADDEAADEPTADNEDADETSAEDAEGSADLDDALSSQPITDETVISELQNQLRDRLDEAWTEDPTFTEDLEYRVRVTEDGEILGFRFANDAAVDNVDEVPLSDLSYTETEDSVQEPTAEYRVVFTPAGVIEVSPWFGRPTP
ncbi:DUF4335 domain-containing protein [Vacuolonema iberomarrocanum]|uniref:DUF4335 domain-containing protein n=1 Tax=Vacuolonema iberomarrocanum TaxID=3454632 RepID=UPI0019FE6AE7|nr:DUF4335 domain-containing protein [filamentous cyanobacterium LEGE 07170]